MVEQQVINETETYFLGEINKFRVDPLSFKQEIINTGKFLSRIPGKKLISEELQNIANKVLSTIPKRDKFIISIGLCKAADEILDNYSNGKEYSKIRGKELTRICRKSLKACGLLFNISDSGSNDSLISRLLISEADTEKTYIKALKNPLFKYCGLATRAIDEDENISVLILSDYIVEVNEEEPLKDYGEYVETISKEEQFILDSLNKFRVDAPSFKQNFQTLSKLFTRIKKKAQSDEAALLASKIDTFPKLSEFSISRGLCKAADEVILHIKQMKSLGLKEGNFIIDMKEIIELNLHSICDKYVIYNETPIVSLDQGDHDLLVARCLISEYDPKREYKKAFISEEFKFVGFASSEVDDETVNVIIFSKDIQDKVLPRYNKLVNNITEHLIMKSEDQHESKLESILNLDLHKENNKVDDQALVNEVPHSNDSQEKRSSIKHDEIKENNEAKPEKVYSNHNNNLEEIKTSPKHQFVTNDKNDHSDLNAVDHQNADKNSQLKINQDKENKHESLNTHQTSNSENEKNKTQTEKDLHSHPEPLKEEKGAPISSTEEEIKYLNHENNNAIGGKSDHKKDLEEITKRKDLTETLESDKKETTQGSLNRHASPKNKDETKFQVNDSNLANIETQMEDINRKSNNNRNDYLEFNDSHTKLLSHKNEYEEHHALLNEGPDSSPLLVTEETKERDNFKKEDSVSGNIYNCIYLIFATVCILAAFKISLIDNQSISFFQTLLLFLGAHGVYISLRNLFAKSSVVVRKKYI